MPDIITASEQDAYAAFFASGGKITKLPPCCLKLEGAVLREHLTGEWTAPEPTGRDKLKAVAEYNKRRKADCAKREAATEERRERARVALAIVQQRQRERVASKVGEVLRFIGTEWTWAKIGQAAKSFGYSKTSALTQFLRAHGHGEKIPHREYRSSTWKPREKAAKKDTSARDAGIIADYKAGMYTRDIRAKWKVGGRVIKAVTDSAGLDRRVRTYTKTIKTVPQKQEIQPSPEDFAIAAMFQAGFSINKCSVKFGKSWDGAAYAITRCGVDLNSRRTKVPPASDEDRAITAYYLSGKGRNETAAAFGVATKKVERAILRCGAKLRTRDEAADMFAARGAA